MIAVQWRALTLALSETVLVATTRAACGDGCHGQRACGKPRAVHGRRDARRESRIGRPRDLL